MRGSIQSFHFIEKNRRLEGPKWIPEQSHPAYNRREKKIELERATLLRYETGRQESNGDIFFFHLNVAFCVFLGVNVRIDVYFDRARAIRNEGGKQRKRRTLFPVENAFEMM